MYCRRMSIEDYKCPHCTDKYMKYGYPLDLPKYEVCGKCHHGKENGGVLKGPYYFEHHQMPVGFCKCNGMPIQEEPSLLNGGATHKTWVAPTKIHPKIMSALAKVYVEDHIK